MTCSHGMLKDFSGFHYLPANRNRLGICDTISLHHQIFVEAG